MGIKLGVFKVCNIFIPPGSLIVRFIYNHEERQLKDPRMYVMHGVTTKKDLIVQYDSTYSTYGYFLPFFINW